MTDEKKKEEPKPGAEAKAAESKDAGKAKAEKKPVEKSKAEPKDADKADDKKEAAHKGASGKPDAEVDTAGKPAVEKAPSTLRVVLGEKVGMSQIFTADGACRAVSVVSVGPCSVVRVKQASGKDGYSAVLLGYGEPVGRSSSKPRAGQFKASGLEPTRWLREFRVADGDIDGFKVGQSVDLGRFSAGDYVDVQGLSKGKGFAGVMKRHNFAGGSASHGASDKERSPGSIASRRSLGRVLPGQKMAGHMGMRTVTVQKIEVVEVDSEKGLLYLDGSVPGAKGSLVTVRETTKRVKKARAKSSQKKKLDAKEQFLQKGKKKRN